MSYYDQHTEVPDSPAAQRELTLSTATIVGIFVGLVLLCGACFGLGYNLGSRSQAAQLAAHPVVAPTDTSADFSGFKPAPGAAAAQAAASSPGPITASAPAAASRDSALSTPQMHASDTAVPTPATDGPAAPPAPAARTPPVGHTAPASPMTRATAAVPAPVAPGGSPAATASAGTFVVQIAAVSHAEDAKLLVSALKAKGYTVSDRTSPADHFFHIQVGPFASKADAEAMRQRLLNDGYNAILK